ncbi:MAG: RagB/SusD family nutrient uptake outer membrane protein, partial [Bacteroidota bacterium]|nr:RagB/SusD family nutrient uptake outer membrane protein [Bacteroidota bacterium]
LQYESQPRLYPAVYNPVGARHAPTLRIAEQYYTKNGVPIEEDPEWDYANRYKLRSVQSDHRYYIKEGEETASLNFDREYRFYADLSHDRAQWFGNGKLVDQNDSWTIEARKGEYSSVFEVSQYSVTGYWPKKLTHIENEIRAGAWYYTIPYAFPVVRMADLYLSYAEALNETKAAPDAEVYEYIDYVRERAGLKGVVESWTTYSANPAKPATKSGMRNIIQKERLIELSFEGSRFWDLRRWKLAQEYLNKPVRGWNVLKQDVREYYRVTTLFNQSFTLRNYLWPIEENETVLNPNLVQNPGW